MIAALAKLAQAIIVLIPFAEKIVGLIGDYINKHKKEELAATLNQANATATSDLDQRELEQVFQGKK